MKKTEILNRLCYTELVYSRINKKLKVNLSKKEIESTVFDAINEASEDCIERRGKNYYISNIQRRIRITINSNTFRIITADCLK